MSYSEVEAISFSVPVELVCQRGTTRKSHISTNLQPHMRYWILWDLWGALPYLFHLSWHSVTRKR